MQAALTSRAREGADQHIDLMYFWNWMPMPWCSFITWRSVMNMSPLQVKEIRENNITPQAAITFPRSNDQHSRPFRLILSLMSVCLLVCPDGPQISHAWLHFLTWQTFSPSPTLCLWTPKCDLSDLYASRKLQGPSFFYNRLCRRALHIPFATTRALTLAQA